MNTIPEHAKILLGKDGNQKPVYGYCAVDPGGNLVTLDLSRPLKPGWRFATAQETTDQGKRALANAPGAQATAAQQARKAQQ